LATLLDKEAPKTCKAILEAVPLEGDLLHGIISGEEVLFAFQNDGTRRLEPENLVFKYIPGDVLFYYNHWGDGKYLKDNPEGSELVFIYGRYVQLRDRSLRQTGASLFASIDDKLPEFEAICRRIRSQGATKVRVARA